MVFLLYINIVILPRLFNIFQFFTIVILPRLFNICIHVDSFYFFQLIVTRRRSYFNVAGAIEMIKLLLLLLIKKKSGYTKCGPGFSF